MLHPIPLGIIPFALGVSTALHAVVLLMPIARPSPSISVSDVSIDVELFTDGSSATATTALESTVGRVDREAAPQEAPHSALLPRGGLRSGHPNSSPPILTHQAWVSADGLSRGARAETAGDETPHFAVTIDMTASVSAGVLPSSNVSFHDDGAAPIPEQAVDARARLERGAIPTYPEAARADGVEGDVRLELVVGISGLVESARVVRGVGHGLDESALRAAREFRFAPASMGGYPVRVRMGWSIQFRLR
jgi:TonB family protein